MTSGPVPRKDIQTHYIYIYYNHSAESNEKSYVRFFPFLFFELWLFTIYGDTPSVPLIKKSCSKVAKFTGKMRIALTMIFAMHEFFFTTFSF